MDGQAADTDGWGPARDLRAGVLASDDARVTMALAPQGPEGSTAEQVLSDIRFARELGLPITMHIGTPYDPQHPSQAIGVLAELDLLGPDMNLVHCCSSSDEQFRQLAAAGSTATVSPMAEVTLGMGYPPTGRMRTAGLTPAIGADAVCATSGDLFEEARHALFAERARCSEGLFSSGRAVIEPQEMGMSSRQALEAITIEGARACWLGDRIGSLTPGKAADVILLRGTDLNLTPMGDLVSSIVCCAQGPNVDTVLVGGQTVKRGGALVGIDVRAIESALRKSYERLVGGAAKASTVP
jgi:5-methylthioadenosine/S-adenosylhomocysteine deaminase